jgi:signal transduction histidine kinase
MAKLRPLIGLGIATVLTGTPATAQAVEVPLVGALGGSVVLAGVAALAVVYFLRWRAATGTASALRPAADRLAGLLQSSPLEYIYWTVAEDREHMSRRFSVLFEGGVKSFADLAEKFSSSEFEKLEQSVKALRLEGRSFGLTLTSVGGTTLDVTGTVVPSETGQPVAHVLWLDDVSDAREEWETLQKTAAAVASARDQLEALVNDLPFAVWLRNTDLTLAWVNRTYAEMVEADAEQVVMGDGVELGANAFAPEPRKLAAEARQSGTPQRETRHIVVEGERRAFEIVEVPVGDDGQVAGFARDATALEETRAELQRHIESHAETLDKLKTPAAIFGIDKHLKFSNRAFARLWQLEESWLESEPHHSEVIEATRAQRRLPEQANFPAWKEQQLELYTKVLEPEEDVWHLPDGTTLRVVVQPHPLGGLLFFYEDMTDWLALERSLNTVLEVQRETLAHLYEAVAVFGENGRLQLYNPAYCKIWQLEESFLVSEPHVSDLVERCRHLFDDQGDWLETKKGIVSTVTDRRATGGRFERPNGTVLEYSAVPLPDGAVLLIYFDVTDSAKIARALTERAEALETADRLKSEFIEKMSYELRTPLNTIIGFSEILSNEYFGTLNSQQKEYTIGIFDASQQLLSLVNDVLDLAMIEAGALELEVGRVDISRLLLGVVNLVSDRVLKHELTLSVECPEDIGTVDGDERRIRQILFNLLSNAIKFNVPGGRITLGATRNESSIALWVEDTGRGIEADEQTRVFEKFETGHGTKRYQGAGLGLSLVRSFVGLHGGKVELDSRRDRGTRVTCILPSAAEVPAIAVDVPVNRAAKNPDPVV